MLSSGFHVTLHGAHTYITNIHTRRCTHTHAHAQTHT